MRSAPWFSCLLLLTTLFLGSLGVQAQTIDNVTVDGTPVCTPGSIQISFRVTNGNGSGNYFTSDTNYKFSLGTLNGTTFTEIPIANNSLTNPPFPSGNPINGSSITINFNLQIPSTAPNGSNYRIKITSTIDPTVTVEGFSGIFVISSPPNAPISNGGLICIGSTATLSASGAVSGEIYKWYNSSTGGTILKTSSNNTDNSYITPAISSTTNYWVSLLNPYGCESTRTKVTATFPANSPDSQTTAGTDTWIGHAYDGTNTVVAFNGNFTNYFGTVSHAETFDQNFGGDNMCFPISSSLGSRSIYTETFSVRYRMNSTKKGLYVLNIGSDDGSRLSVDGQLVYNDWNDHAYRNQNILVNLLGNSKLVLDYYENGGGNRVNFNNLTRILENKLTGNIVQNVCPGATAAAISGDTFGTLPAGLSAAGYQWTYSTSLGGIRNNISGGTSASFSPNLNSAPFNNPGTYYIFRNASLSSANNVNPNPYVATNESNPAILTVNTIPTITGSTPGSRCGTGTVVLGATASAGTINWYAAATGGTSLGTGTTFTTPSISSNTTYYVDATSNTCTTGSRTAVLATVNTIPTITGSTPGSRCGTGTVVLGATASAGTINWYAAATGGTSLGTGTTFTTPSISSNTTYYVDATSNTCTTGSRTAVLATVKTIPTIISTTPGSRCGTGTVVLGATASAGTINWYTAATGGTSLGTGTTFTTPSNSSNTTYYVDATSNTCTTGSRTAVLATVNTIPTIISTSGSRCGTGTVVLGATASAGTINWYAAATGGTSLGTGTTFTTPSISSNTTYYVDATVIASGCTTTTRTAVIATIKPIPSAPTVGSNSPIMCEGGTINLTASFITGATYSWTGPNGFTSTQQNPSLTNASVAMAGTYTVTSTVNGCTSVGANTDVIVNTIYIWTGTTDTNWNNTSNWRCNLLPTLETNVLIPENLTSNNFPIINAGTNALTKNLSIETGASVIVNDNWLRIAGNLTNSGVLNTESGSISFEGANAQIIPASVFEKNRIRNLRINNASGVTSKSIIEVTGTLKVETGNFDTGGNKLSLISNEVQTALIDGSGEGEVIGLVSMQRYLDKAFGYKYFSSPFQNSVVDDFAPYMDFADPTTSFPHFYRYNENRNISINDTLRDATGWVVHTGNLNIAEGYALNFGTTSNPVVIELYGEVNNGPIAEKSLLNHHKNYTKGFHLIGNPYPSPIDWNAPNGWTRTNIDNAIYFFNASDNDQYTGSYTSFVNNVSTGNNATNSTPNIIPSMQGFFIKVSDLETGNDVTGTLGMNNKVRSTDYQEFYKASERDLKPLIRLNAGYKAETKKDVLVIYFSSYATPNFEKEMDAHKLMNTDPAVPSFYNITEDKKELAINAIPFPESRSYKKIPLGIKSDQSGEMRIDLASVENLNPNFNIYLIDHEKSKGQNLRNKPEYTFSIKKGTHNSRFELMFSEVEVTSPAIAFNEPFDVAVEDGSVVVSLNLEENQVGILRASTITGQILQIKEAGGKDRVVFDGITSNGVYIINLQLGKAQHAKKVIIKK